MYSFRFITVIPIRDLGLIDEDDQGCKWCSSGYKTRLNTSRFPNHELANEYIHNSHILTAKIQI